MNACIAVPGTSDKYLTRDSVQFHKRLGYRLVGEFRQVGYKFGRWYNMVWMEKHLGPHIGGAVPPAGFGSMRGRVQERYGID